MVCKQRSLILPRSSDTRCRHSGLKRWPAEWNPAWVRHKMPGPRGRTRATGRLAVAAAVAAV
eukprot:8681623-Lingulodinium_polyedra.AAC.1